MTTKEAIQRDKLKSLTDKQYAEWLETCKEELLVRATITKNREEQILGITESKKTITKIGFGIWMK